MPDNLETKEAVLERLAPGTLSRRLGRAKWEIRGKVLHVRFCSTDREDSQHYKFNINPNTLTADFEVWICGSEAVYYLIPISRIREIYASPDAYVDRHHPEIRVVSVRSDAHCATYAAGGRSLDLGPFLNSPLQV